MLTSLLPGFRDVRSAIVAGFMWVFAAWLFAAHAWPALLMPGLVFAPPLTGLITTLGQGGSLVALGVVCLLVGEVTAGLAQAATARLSLVSLERLDPATTRRPLDAVLHLFRPLSSRAIRRLYAKAERVHPQLTPPPSSPAPTPDELGLGTVREVLFLAPRLIIAKPELYTEHQRYLGEADFRDAITVPMPVLTVAILVNTAIPVWVGLLLTLVVLVFDAYLFFQARINFRTAYSMLAHAIADGTISSATLSDRLPEPATSSSSPPPAPTP